MGVLEEDVHGRIRAQVESQSNSDRYYRAEVTQNENGLWNSSSCSCPDAKKLKGECKHVLAVYSKLQD